MLRQPALVWMVGVGGLFGYHALYFLALRFAPPAEAGLLNYLWPLLIVLFSSLLPGERLAPHHIVGALLGLCGTVLLFAGNSGHGFAPGQLPGLIAAFVAAFVWAAYSVMSRKLKAVPTDAVAGFCLATALLAALVHSLVETTVWPETTSQWLAIIALGIGPVGAAFYAWDIGMKRGDIRVLGAASYATPLLSTAFLILAGFAQASATIAIAAILIAGGGLIAAKDMIWKRSSLKLSRGVQPFGASSNFAKSNPGATVQPTSVQSPVLSAACQACGGTIACGISPAARSGPSRMLRCRRRRRSAGSARCRRNNARPRPHRCGANASARRAPAGNRSRWKRRGHRRRRVNREMSRDNGRLRDAASGSSRAMMSAADVMAIAASGLVLALAQFAEHLGRAGALHAHAGGDRRIVGAQEHVGLLLLAERDRDRRLALRRAAV